jgi:autophagy-related protein 101
VPIQPACRDLLDLTLPIVKDNDLETLIDQRATSLARAVELPYSSSPASRNTTQSGRAQISVAFYETKKKKKKTVAYFFSKPDEEICWESWVLHVTCATPKSESGRRSTTH